MIVKDIVKNSSVFVLKAIFRVIHKYLLLLVTKEDELPVNSIKNYFFLDYNFLATFFVFIFVLLHFSKLLRNNRKLSCYKNSCNSSVFTILSTNCLILLFSTVFLRNKQPFLYYFMPVDTILARVCVVLNCFSVLYFIDQLILVKYDFALQTIKKGDLFVLVLFNSLICFIYRFMYIEGRLTQLYCAKLFICSPILLFLLQILFYVVFIKFMLYLEDIKTMIRKRAVNNVILTTDEINI